MCFSQQEINFLKNFNRSVAGWYLLKRRTTLNDLKRPTTNMKQTEATYNEQETTWNDPQRVKHNLQRSEVTKNRQKKTGNQQQQGGFEII